VIGGHLHRSDPVLVAPEDEIATPLGPLTVNRELASLIAGNVESAADRRADNTVEIQMPFVAYLFETTDVVYLRVPPSEAAIRVGSLVAEYASGRPGGVRVIGSTDLSHYGPNYGSSEYGVGPEARRLVRDNLDRPFVQRMLDMDAEAVIDHAERTRSACSAGAAAAAIAFARGAGCTSAQEVGYYSSREIQPSDSYVGYAGVGFAP
jgi:AmmeMemoRadiSam system protein B